MSTILGEVHACGAKSMPARCVSPSPLMGEGVILAQARIQSIINLINGDLLRPL
jgi:hypothetical protein